MALTPEERYEAWKKKRYKEQFQRSVKKTKNKQNRKSSRTNTWNENTDWEDADFRDDERIMPRGENERRRTVEQIMQGSLEPTEGSTTLGTTDSNLLNGLVIEVRRGAYQVELEDEERTCTTSGTLSTTQTGFTNLLAVGDEVLVQPISDGTGVIQAVQPRRSMLTRLNVHNSHTKQIIAANIDQLLIVAAWREPYIWPELIDRYLITAAFNHLHPVLCINKIDLVEDQSQLTATLAPYRVLDMDIILTSVNTGAGLLNLEAILDGKISVLAGLSGVGKSSLLNAIKPDLKRRTGSVSEGSLFRGQGQHTTTEATLLDLGKHTKIIDTPGIKEFGLVEIKQKDLQNYYPEFASRKPDCRFSDCLHLEEPDCAVKAACEEGSISTERYNNYCKILMSLDK